MRPTLVVLRCNVFHTLFFLTQQSNVYVYYGLSNFYQNHRRYVKSRDDSQLNGNTKSLKVPTASDPLELCTKNTSSHVRNHKILRRFVG